MESRLHSHSHAGSSCTSGLLPRGSTQAPLAGTHAGSHRRRVGWPALAPPHRPPRRLTVRAALEAPARPAAGGTKRGEGHSALLQGLGQVGDVSASHMPWLLRLAHIRCAAGSSTALLPRRPPSSATASISAHHTWHSPPRSSSLRECRSGSARWPLPFTGPRWKAATPRMLSRTAREACSCGGCAPRATSSAC